MLEFRFNLLKRKPITRKYNYITLTVKQILSGNN